LIKAKTINSGLSNDQALEGGKGEKKSRPEISATKKPIQLSSGWALINEVESEARTWPLS
jgi:hypothetical protein